MRLGTRDQAIPQAVRPPEGRAGIPRLVPVFGKCAGECLKEPWSERDAGAAGQADSSSRQARMDFRGVAGCPRLKG